MLELLKQRNFSLLWFGGLVSFTGDWLTLIALPLYIYTLTGSVLATSFMWMAFMVPSVIFGSLAGVFVDRWDRRVTMLVTNFLTVPLMLVLLLVQTADAVWIIYVVVFLKSTIGNFMGPAENALLPKLVGEEHLTTANALNTLNNTLARLIGPALGGAVYAVFGYNYSVILDASSFAIAGVLISLIAAPRSVTRAEAENPEGEQSEQARPNVWRELVSGLQLVWGRRLILLLFIFMSVAMLSEGLFEVLVIPYVSDVLNGGSQELGWLFTTQAVGGLLGGVLIGKLGKKVNPANLIGPGLIVLGLMTIATFNVPVLALDLLFFAAVGPAVVALQTGTQTLLQTQVEDRYRGRVFGTFGTLVSLAILAGQLVAGLLGGQIGAVLLMTVGGLMPVLAGVLALVVLGRMLGDTQQRTAESLPVAEGEVGPA